MNIIDLNGENYKVGVDQVISISWKAPNKATLMSDSNSIICFKNGGYVLDIGAHVDIPLDETLMQTYFVDTPKNREILKTTIDKGLDFWRAVLASQEAVRNHNKKQI